MSSRQRCNSEEANKTADDRETAIQLISLMVNVEVTDNDGDVRVWQFNYSPDYE
jgi:hypothetical protein